jgi:CRP-like cAMP-binding protein
MALQDVPIFARATADELLALAAIARDVPISAGSELFREGEPAAIHVVMNGQVRITGADGLGAIAGPGDSMGIVQALGGGLCEACAHIVESGRALRIDREPLFDLLGERMDLLRGLFTVVLHDAATFRSPSSEGSARDFK